MGVPPGRLPAFWRPLPIHICTHEFFLAFARIYIFFFFWHFGLKRIFFLFWSLAQILFWLLPSPPLQYLIDLYHIWQKIAIWTFWHCLFKESIIDIYGKFHCFVPNFDGVKNARICMKFSAEGFGVFLIFRMLITSGTYNISF